MSEQDISTGTLEDGGEAVDRQMREAMVNENAQLRDVVEYLQTLAEANTAFGFVTGVAYAAKDASDAVRLRAKAFLDVNANALGERAMVISMTKRADGNVVEADEYGRVAESMFSYAAK